MSLLGPREWCPSWPVVRAAEVLAVVPRTWAVRCFGVVSASVSAFYCEIANKDAGCFGVSAFAPFFKLCVLSVLSDPCCRNGCEMKRGFRDGIRDTIEKYIRLISKAV